MKCALCNKEMLIGTMQLTEDMYCPDCEIMQKAEYPCKVKEVRLLSDKPVTLLQVINAYPTPEGLVIHVTK